VLHYKDLTETGNRARKVSGTQGTGMWEQSLLIIPKQTLQGTAGIFYRSHSTGQNTGHRARDK